MKEKIKNIKDKLVNLFKRFTNYLKNLNKNQVIILIVNVLIVVVVITLVVVLIPNKGKEENKIKPYRYYVPKAMFKEKEIEGFKFSDIDFDYKDGIFEYKVKVTNTTKEAKEFYGVSVSLIKDNYEVGNIKLYNDTTIQPGKSIELSNFSTKNYVEADNLWYNLLEKTTK